MALVTGAAGGLGSVISAHLADAGYAVALIGRDAARLEATRHAIAAAGNVAIVAPADITEPTEVDVACSAAEQLLGPVDVLVNAAGWCGEFNPVTQADPEAWWHTLKVNLRGPALMAQRLVPGMVERRHGHVVTLASSAAFWDDDGTASSYAVSKAAAMRLTRALAMEVAGSGVLVVDVSPGLVRTSMTAQLPGYETIPSERFTAPETAARLVLRVITGDYGYLHGRFIHVRDDLEDIQKLVRQSSRARTLGLLTSTEDRMK